MKFVSLYRFHCIWSQPEKSVHRLSLLLVPLLLTGRVSFKCLEEKQDHPHNQQDAGQTTQNDGIDWHNQ
jgi:hypothetical protein